MGLDTFAKRYYVGIVAALLVIVAYLQSRGISSLIAEQLQSNEITVAGKRDTALATPPTVKTARTILARNPFDSKTGPLSDKPVKAPPPVSSAPVIAPVGDPVLPVCPNGGVVLIVGADDPKVAFAVIQGNGTSAKMRRIGDDVDGKKVESIHREHVVLGGGADRCQLKMHDGHSSMSSAAGPVGAMGNAGRDADQPSVPTEAPPRATTGPIGGIRKLSETQWEIEGDGPEKVGMIKGAIQKSGRLVEGKGMKLYKITSTTILGQLGLKKDDIIRSVNGADMADLDRAMTAMDTMKTAKSLTVVLDRGGKQQTFEYSIK
ncbi:MAG: type II secretion system protein GspC [Polyangiaceae bacterium]